MSEASIPITVVAGYLGAGKTTYINDQLSRRDDLTGLAILVNDFGQINIDAALIESRSPDGTVIGLSNGCVCCSIQDDFASTLEQIRQMNVRDVLLEASGVAVPGKLRQQCAYPGFFAAKVMVLVDASAFARQTSDRYVGQLVQQQLAEADELLITKRDLNPQFKLPTRIATLAQAVPPRFVSITLLQHRDISVEELRSLLEDLPVELQRLKGFVGLTGAGTTVAQCVGTSYRLEPGIVDAPRYLVLISTAECAQIMNQVAERFCGLAWQREAPNFTTHPPWHA